MLPVLDHPHLIAHPPLANHPPRNIRGLLDVSSSAVGHITENEFLGDASTHDHDQAVQKLVLALCVLVFGRQIHRRAE